MNQREYLVISFDNIDYVTDAIYHYDTHGIFDEMVGNGDVFIEDNEVGFVVDKLHIVALILSKISYMLEDYELSKIIHDIAIVTLTKHCEAITQERIDSSSMMATIKSKPINNTLH